MPILVTWPLALGDSRAVAGAFHRQRVLLVAGRDDPLFPISGVDEVVAAFAPRIADHEIFDGGHDIGYDRALAWFGGAGGGTGLTR